LTVEQALKDKWIHVIESFVRFYNILDERFKKGKKTHLQRTRNISNNPPIKVPRKK